MVIPGVVQVAVRVALHVDLLQDRKGLRVEHRDRLRGCKSVACCRIDRSAVCADAWNVSHLRQGIEVKHTNVPGRTRPRHIKVATVGVGRHVIESTITSHQLDPEDLVRPAVLCEGGERKQNGEGCEHERLA